MDNKEIQKLIRLFQAKIPRTVTKIYDGGSRLLVATRPKEGFKNFDPYYTMKRDGSDIRGYSKADESIFEKAIQKPIFQLESDEELEARRKRINDEWYDAIMKEIDKEE